MLNGTSCRLVFARCSATNPCLSCFQQSVAIIEIKMSQTFSEDCKCYYKVPVEIVIPVCKFRFSLVKLCHFLRFNCFSHELSSFGCVLMPFYLLLVTIAKYVGFYCRTKGFIVPLFPATRMCPLCKLCL